MIELTRVIEDQTNLYSYRATENETLAQQLDLAIEITKPNLPYSEWHKLISTPFRYSPPLPNARFRPQYGKNVFYASVFEETALYEYSFHFMKERIHLNIETEMGARTIFFVDAHDDNSFHIQHESHFSSIIDKNNYLPSHQFIENNSHLTFIIYPSCRDPLHRDNAAIFDIHRLEKNPKWESSIKFFYDNKKNVISWLDYDLHIEWAQVI